MYVVPFGEPWNEKCWYILWPVRIFYGTLVFLLLTRPFGIFCGQLVWCPVFTKKNLTALKNSASRADVQICGID
jgi:hypothetical protein